VGLRLFFFGVMGVVLHILFPTDDLGGGWRELDANMHHFIASYLNAMLVCSYLLVPGNYVSAKKEESISPRRQRDIKIK